MWNGEDWDNFGGAIDMSLFAELGKDAHFNTVTATTFTGNLDGTATKATQDADGNTIADTYLKKSGGTMSGNIVLSDPYTGIGLGSNTGIEFGEREVLMVTGEEGIHFVTKGGTSSSIDSNGAYHGDVVGNADTATKATQDADGNELTDPQKYMHVSHLDSADFNDIRTTGIYMCKYGTYTNTPVNSWGVLRVYQIQNNSIKQEYVLENKPEVYVRYCTAGTWNAWGKVNAGNAVNDGNGNNIADTYETKSDSNAKFNETASYTNRLQRNKTYKVGDIAYSPNLPSWAYLECVTAGTTGDTEPDFSTIGTNS